MKPVSKAGLVALGYVIAFVIASAAVAVRVILTMGPVAQASSGMYAFGDAILVVVVFGLLALVPTTAALVWLRPYARFWIALSTAGLFLRSLISPLFLLAFLVCAIASPQRSFRIALSIAMALEAVVSAYGGWTWFVPQFFGES